MTPRPRTATDAEILAATARAIARVGPVRLTLAEVAAEVGLSPATLVQRFGSKRGLLLAFAQQGGGEGDPYEAIRATHASPLEALFAAATCTAQMAETPEALSNHLAFLQIDLTDPDFHRLALAHGRANRVGLHALVRAAVEAGELRAGDTERLARLVETVIGGSLISWAIYREGDAEAWVRADLAALLEPYRTGPGCAVAAPPGGA
ncbi:MAG TPA: helix-turn-helix domain-containing protein [Longimicrobiaceae bacterium]|nr:helix-turn-helix domain-containing protein [Longimicrobiaceae bacterium]